MRNGKTLKLGLSAICVGAILGVAAASQAASITLDVGASGTDVLGEVIPSLSSSGGPSGQANRDSAMVTQLIGMSAPSSTTISGIKYTRSSNPFSPLSAVSLTGLSLASGGGITQNGSFAEITLTSAFRYLVASYDGSDIKHDGSSGGTEVWDISGLTSGTVIDIPWAAQSPLGLSSDLQTDTKYNITSWTLFNPLDNSGHDVVPDGGSTVALLGFGLLGIATLRQRLSRK